MERLQRDLMEPKFEFLAAMIASTRKSGLTEETTGKSADFSDAVDIQILHSLVRYE